MKLSNVLSMVGNRSEKTAADTSSAVPAVGEKTATQDKLIAALKDATSGSEKVASAAGSPVEDLTKIASQVASAEHEALVKEAELYGASVADGFVSRLAMYEGAAAKLAPGAAMVGVSKVASADSFEKFASENPELVKQAAEVGFASTNAQLEKLAEAAHQKGYNDQVEAIYKTANAAFVSGYEAGMGLVLEARK